MLYFIFLFLILYFIFAWRKLDWAVVLIIFSLPSYLIRFKIAGIPMTILEAMILIAFFVWFIKETNFLNFLRGKYKIKNYLENRKARKPYPFGRELSLLLLISWVAAIIAGFGNEALGIWKAYFFEPALFFILVLNVFRFNTNNTNDTRNNNEEPTQPSLSQGEGENNKEDLTPSLSLLRRGGTKIPLAPFVKGGLDKLLWALAGSAFFVSVFAIYQKFTGTFIDNPLWAAVETRRVTSFFPYPNAVGLYLGPIVMILTGWLFSVIARVAKQSRETCDQPRDCHGLWPRNDKVKKILIVLDITLSLLAIYFAKSEGALFGIIVALFVFGVLAGKKLRWITIISALIIGIGAISYQPARTKIFEKLTLRDLSGEIRKQQWRETWQMMTVSPTRFIFGTGLSGYQKAIAPYHKEGIFFNKDREPWEQFHRKTVFNEEYRRTHWQPVEIYMYPHNIMLNFWTEMGMAGAILFIFIFIKFFTLGISNFKFQIKTSENIKYLNIGLMCSMLVILIHGAVDVPYFKNDLAVMFWLLVALTSIINFEKNKSSQI